MTNFTINTACRSIDGSSDINIVMGIWGGGGVPTTAGRRPSTDNIYY